MKVLLHPTARPASRARPSPKNTNWNAAPMLANVPSAITSPRLRGGVDCGAGHLQSVTARIARVPAAHPAFKNRSIRQGYRADSPRQHKSRPDSHPCSQLCPAHACPIRPPPDKPAPAVCANHTYSIRTHIACPDPRSAMARQPLMVVLASTLP